MKRLSGNRLTIAILIGVISGFLIGIILKKFTNQPWTDRQIMYFQFPGELFLRSINCLILPLIISSIVSATSHVSKCGNIGIKVLCYYVTTTTLGITLCIILAETIRPGEFHKTEEFRDLNSSRKFITTDTFLDLFRNLITDDLVGACLYHYHTVLLEPKNQNFTNETESNIYSWEISHQKKEGTNILGLVGFSLLLGFAIGSLEEKGKPLFDFFQALSDVSMSIMNFIIEMVPFSVIFLIPPKILQTEDVGLMMSRLGIYVVTVFLGLIIHGLIVLPSLYFICTRKSPFRIFAKIGPAIVTAIGTSSSTATVPVTLKCLDDLSVNPKISRFVVPIGATINMDGIALYETMGALFIIQLRGLDTSLTSVIAIAITCTVSCIGAAGLPNGGYVMLIIVLESIGIPAEDVTLIITIDCLVSFLPRSSQSSMDSSGDSSISRDRIRTIVNIIADTLGASLISHLVGSREVEEESELQEPLHLENIKL